MSRIINNSNGKSPLAGLVIPHKEPRYSFFSGKGGVGKTTMSASTAVWLAQQGYKTLIISTDLQKSLNDVFQQDTVGDEVPIRSIPNLWAKTIETGESLMRHREKMLETLKLVDADSPIVKMIDLDKNTDCGCGQAALFEFGEYLKNPKDYEAIVFDTAPAGTTLEKIMNQTNHVLSLAEQLETKKILAGALGQSGSDKQIKALEAMKADEDRAIATLQSDRSSFIMVMYPEAMPLAEVERDVPVLEEIYKIQVRGILINNVLPEAERGVSDFWKSRWAMQAKYLGITRRKFSSKVLVEIPLLETEALGLELLSRIGKHIFQAETVAA